MLHNRYQTELNQDEVVFIKLDSIEVIKKNDTNSMHYEGFQPRFNIRITNTNRYDAYIRLETKSCRILYRKSTVKYDGT